MLTDARATKQLFRHEYAMDENYFSRIFKCSARGFELFSRQMAAKAFQEPPVRGRCEKGSVRIVCAKHGVEERFALSKL